MISPRELDDVGAGSDLEHCRRRDVELSSVEPDLCVVGTGCDEQRRLFALCLWPLLWRDVLFEQRKVQKDLLFGLELNALYTSLMTFGS